MLRPGILLALWLAAVASAGEAAVLAEKTDVDLGFVYRDEPQKMVFPLENLSSDSLRITSIQPSCDCTTAQVVPAVIPPGAKGEVVVFFDPKGYEVKGKVKESVKLFTSDHTNSELLFTFAIQVGIGPEPEPRSLAFGRIARGASDTLRVVVRPAKSGPSGVPQPLKLEGARSADSHVTIARVAKNADGLDEISVVVANKDGAGEVSSFVTVETSDSLRPEIRIPVKASLGGSITVEPGVIAFGPTLPGKYVQQTVKIWSPDKIKFAVESVTSSLAQLEFEAKPAADGSFQLSIKVKDGAEPGRLTGDAKIVTDREGEAPLVLRVTGYVRSSK